MGESLGQSPESDKHRRHLIRSPEKVVDFYNYICGRTAMEWDEELRVGRVYTGQENEPVVIHPYPTEEEIAQELQERGVSDAELQAVREKVGKLPTFFLHFRVNNLETCLERLRERGLVIPEDGPISVSNYAKIIMLEDQAGNLFGLEERLDDD